MYSRIPEILNSCANLYLSNGFIFPVVYFFYPETAYRSLEEMDHIFHKVSGGKGWFDVVKVAKNEPYRYGKNGEVLIEYDETDAAQEGRRRSSVYRSNSFGDSEKKMQSDGVTHVSSAGSDVQRY